MLDQFSFLLQTQTYYGIGYSRKLGEWLQEKGYRRPAILVDEGVERHSAYFAEIRELVSGAVEELYILTLRGSEEPDYDYLDEVAVKLRERPDIDLFIGIGGGSTLDITKAAAVLQTNPGRGLEYRGFDKVTIPGVPTLAIPTTAGTGSEVTINAVFTDKKELKKLGINGRYLNATYALLDAEWTASCPPAAALSAGMDALTHSLESFMCNKANPLTRVFSREAFRLLYGALPALVEAPGDLAKRQQLLLGSYFAAIALFNSGSGISGALSYPVGVHFKVPHGIGGGIFLASVVEYNAAHGYTDYAELLDLIEPSSGSTPAEKSRRFATLLGNLSERLGVPHYLDQWGITSDNVANAAELMLPLQGAFDQNPIPFSAASDASEMLARHVRH